MLGSGRSRDVFLEIFEQVRRKYDFQVIGFVVMPEHIHLLISEPKQVERYQIIFSGLSDFGSLVLVIRSTSKLDCAHVLETPHCGHSR